MSTGTSSSLSNVYTKLQVIIWRNVRLFSWRDKIWIQIQYSGMSIKRKHYKADTFVRRIVWRRTDCFALRSNCLRKNLYKADTFFAPMVSALQRFHCSSWKSLIYFLYYTKYVYKISIYCYLWGPKGPWNVSRELWNTMYLCLCLHLGLSMSYRCDLYFIIFIFIILNHGISVKQTKLFFRQFLFF